MTMSGHCGRRACVLSSAGIHNPPFGPAARRPVDMISPRCAANPMPQSRRSTRRAPAGALAFSNRHRTSSSSPTTTTSR